MCSLLAAIVSGQLSIEVPIDTSITVSTVAYKYAGKITVNSIIPYIGSSICVQPNAHLVASISKIPATNCFGIGDNDYNDGTNTGSTSNYAGYDFTGDMK